MTPEQVQSMDRADRARQRRLTDPSALPAAALWYAKQGIPVFPVYPTGKEPLTRHGFKDATTDTSTIRSWWGRWPLANIAAPTGVRFDVIDVDGREGVRSLVDCDHLPCYTPDRECGSSLIAQLRPRLVGKASTPRPGGLHLYLPPDSRRRNGAKLAVGVDTRARGGYVLMPPSVTCEHGPYRRYTWLSPLVVS